MNLINYLPKYYRAVAEIIVLQKVIQNELEELDITSQDFIDQLFIYTATWSLPVWEKQFNLPIGDESTNLQERRERIIAKMRGYGTSTVEMIKRVGNAFTNGGVEVIEYPDEYRFELVFTSKIGRPPKIEDYKFAIDEIKPAHLGYKFVFRYRTWQELESKKWRTLEKYTWKDANERGELN